MMVPRAVPPAAGTLTPPTVQRASRARYGALGLTLALTAVSYLDRVCISTAAPAIKSDLGISDAGMGYVFSAFTLAYAMFEVPSGWLADRFGARLMLTRIVLWWSAMTAATGSVTTFRSLLTVRFLFGVGEAGTFPSIARVYSRWLPATERGRAFGLAIMTAALGGAATQPLVVLLLGLIQWRHTFMLFGAVGALWALAWFCGTMNTFGNLGGALSPVVVGLCLQWWGSWNVSLITVSIGYVVAALCWLAIDPTKPIPER